MVERSLRLSNGPGVAGRVIGVVVGLVFAAGGLFFAAVVLSADRFLESLDASNSCDPSDLPPEVFTCSGSVPPHIGVVDVIGLVAGGGFALLGLAAVAYSLRAATWLSGSTLRQRGTFRTRAVDLPSADVTLGTVTTSNDDNRSRRVPVLVARDPASGRRLRLSLSGSVMDLLPPTELRALADAITAGRPVSDVDAWRAATHLHQLADNPLMLQVR